MGESQTVRSLNVVIYTPDRPTCEVSRAKDMKQPPSAEWAGLKISDECHQIAVGEGTDYWVFAYSGTGAVGASDRDRCKKIREVLVTQTRAWLGECQPVAVKRLQ
jgi:hypothetical protein